MYTLEEINKEASSKGWKAFWLVFLFTGIGFPILGVIIMLVIAPKSIDWESITGFLVSVSPMSFMAGLFGGTILRAVIAFATTKNMKEENEQEEREKREEHYRKMEEMMEKMSKQKE